MARLGRSLEEYQENNGWSSAFFAKNAVSLMSELSAKGVNVVIGRTVVHLKTPNLRLKAYVHHNGRTEEYATITDWRGTELLTVHYTDFETLANFLRKQLT